MLALYCSLVIIELGLKDQRTPWPQGHAVQRWLNELNDAGLNSFTYQLATELQSLTCTDRSGSEAQVALDHYPDLRYLRHETDFPGRSTDANIGRALAIVEQIRAELQRKGIV